MGAFLKKHKKLIIILLILVVLIGIGLAVAFGLKRFKSRSAASDMPSMRQQQNYVMLTKQDLLTSISATGTIESAQSKTVSASLNNIEIEKVLVEVGDEVKEGDSLIEFNKEDLTEALAEANADLNDAVEKANENIADAKEKLQDAQDKYNEDKAEMEEKVAEAKEAVADAKAEVKAIKKEIKKETDEMKKKELEEKLAKAEEALEQAENAYEQALDNLENTNEQNEDSIDNAQDAVENAQDEKEKAVEEASKKVEEAQDALDNCAVVAPISGLITAVNVEDGDSYNGGEMFTIEDVSSYTVTTTVDEYDIINVEKGQRVVILTEATGDDELEGEITFVAPSKSSGSSSGMGNSSSSSGYEVKIKVTTTDERLRLGLTAKCSLILEEATDVYAVPYDAIHENAAGASVVYVLRDGSASEYDEVEVTVGMETDYYVEISGDGLEEGMRIMLPTDEIDVEVEEEESSEEFQFPGGGQMPGGNGDGQSFPGGGDGNRGGGNNGGGGMTPPGM